MNETELGAKVINWIAPRVKDVYTEPDGISGRKRPDIVLIHTDGAVEIVELKVKWTRAAMKQAAHWRGHANLITLAVAELVSNQRLLDIMAEMHACGLSLIEGGRVEPKRSVVGTYGPAPLRKQVLDALDFDHKISAPAGSTGVVRYTALDRTLSRLELRIGSELEPLRLVMNGVQHHYLSNKSACEMMRNLWQSRRLPFASMKFQRGEWWIKRGGIT